MTPLRLALGLAVCTFFVAVQSASAQYRDFFPRRYQVDHHDHVIRDSHGHVVGRYHHDVVREDSDRFFPSTRHFHNRETYFIRNGKYYFSPKTVLLGNGVVPQPEVVGFGSFSHVDDLASQLETQMKYFLLDMHYNYSHNHGFRETYAEAYQLYQVAQYVHAQEHQHNHNAIKQQLNGMDALFHHIEEDVRGWSRHQHFQVGNRGIGSKMQQIESTLHHLMNDVGVDQVPLPATTVPVPVPSTLSPVPSVFLTK
ncbi:hypothetical protein Pla110_40200 [Polystyrenella longa]|uniref:Uncharacterized protein n=1 Tax=Polystyrenella longa TaxID=2528007 RepID=A0A518CSS7_9PLAN|nr:hypothetical protein [Polystyrenella longa]QDU82265.1 hypothetical protein Pla110_40200 [Polystyrenella longa]